MKRKREAASSSGRAICVDDVIRRFAGGDDVSVWLLTADRRWERRCVLIVLQAHLKSRIFLYDDATGAVTQLNAPPNASPEREQSRDVVADVLAIMKPLNEMDNRRGHDATLGAVYLMEFLVGIMQKLPSNLRHGFADIDRFYTFTGVI
uniref:Uncharacterized protein n=1 Tax=Leersia perrieri TaxID=77586 RepID=A0A0D9X970_9ORYZ